MKKLSGEAKKNNDDIEIMIGISKADSLAFNRLYNKYQRTVYSIIIRIVRSEQEACEIVQDAFMQIWQKASLFDPLRGSVPAWITTIAHNKAINYLRSHRAKTISLEINQSHEQFLELLNEKTIELHTPCDDHLDLERRTQVVALLKELPQDQGEALYLSYYEGYSQSEIGKLLNVPLGTIKTRMRQGMMKLQYHLKRSKYSDLIDSPQYSKSKTQSYMKANSRVSSFFQRA